MSRQARQRRRRRSRGAVPRLLMMTFGAVLMIGIAGVLGVAAYVVSIADRAPNPNNLRPVIAGSSSELFAANGTRLGWITSSVLRTPVTSAEIPNYLKEGTVAIEDQRFYHENGVDLRGIFRAAVDDVIHGTAVQGGSTITMQLMRNLYLGADTKSFKQKIQEAAMAMDYEKDHSKSYILTQYLNAVPYGTVGGQTALGVAAAARVFFDKPVHELNLAQCALLAGLPQAPSEYNPFLDRSAATIRRNEVLTKMFQLGYISYAQEQRAIATPVVVHANDYYGNRVEPFFFNYVQQQLIGRYGLHTVEHGGLRVYTTINLKMQQEARSSIAEVLDDPGDPSSAIVTLNPNNGYIEAMAESESYDQSNFNLAAQGLRQAGSTFKAIDLADALAHGVDPFETTYLSHTLPDGWLKDYPTYNVHTFENTSLDKEENLVQATLTSDNTVYAQLAADLGETTITHMARLMGVEQAKLYSIPSEALGGLKYGVSPLEMAVVYATLADGGYRNTPIAITKVVFPNGRVDTSWGTPHRVKVLSNGVTGVETEILHENIQSGTAAAANISCPAAAKTGTTSDFVDAWLDGYTPNFSTVVWMGYPNKSVPMLDVHGEEQQGGALPAQIWHDYMTQVVGSKCVPFPKITQPIKYEPFYGHFATSSGTGGSLSADAYSYTGTGVTAPLAPTGNSLEHGTTPASGGTAPTVVIPDNSSTPAGGTGAPGTGTPATGTGTPAAGAPGAPTSDVGGSAPTGAGAGGPPGGSAGNPPAVVLPSGGGQ
ncbi:MAG TPA: transglycosylase domain-containing protein [Solirubrobacteraceae bacterium]|jgi:penicillin-binding protein 1A|nr:transglycosylase domain-containing protein [Solirubrobacteraceae bacterium]